MKEFCINQTKFEKVLGYGSWTIITTTLLVFLTISVIEMDSVYEKFTTTPTGAKIYDGASCYVSVFSNEPKCSTYWSMEGRTSEVFVLLLIGNSGNLSVLSLFIYNKQQKFKIKWCDKN